MRTYSRISPQRIPPGSSRHLFTSCKGPLTLLHLSQYRHGSQQEHSDTREVLRLPREIRIASPPTVAACRRYHACLHLHLSCKTTFQTSKYPESPTPATKHGHNPKQEHRAPVKLHLWTRAKPDKHFVRACAVEMHMDISQGRKPVQTKRATQMEHHDLNPALLSYRKNRSVWTPCLGNIFQ